MFRHHDRLAEPWAPPEYRTHGPSGHRMWRASGVLLLLFASACHGATPATTDPRAETPVNGKAALLTAERLYANGFSALPHAAREVVSDSAAWIHIWRRVMGSRRVQTPAPGVDFTRARVVVVAAGPQAETSLSLAIEGIDLADSATIVRIHRRVIGGACGVAAARTSPVDIYRVPRTPAPVRFVERSDTLTCGGR